MLNQKLLAYVSPWQIQLIWNALDISLFDLPSDVVELDAFFGTFIIEMSFSSMTSDYLSLQSKSKGLDDAVGDHRGQ